MLACFERSQCPFVVQAIGKRNVDGVYVGVVKEILVRLMDGGDVVLFGIVAGSCLISGGDGGDDDVWMRFCGVDEGDGSVSEV